MPAWRRDVDAVIARELGGAARAVTVSFVGRTTSVEARRRTIADAAGGLDTDGTLVVVDHNRPRRRLAALAALVRAPWIPGVTPGARWRRQARPTARELQDAGFRVERLRLAAGERVQVVFARKR